jgi:hypothetical protein
LGQAGWLNPSEAAAARPAGRRQNSPAPLAGVATRQNAIEELGGEGQ